MLLHISALVSNSEKKKKKKNEEVILNGNLINGNAQIVALLTRL